MTALNEERGDEGFAEFKEGTPSFRRPTTTDLRLTYLRDDNVVCAGIKETLGNL